MTNKDRQILEAQMAAIDRRRAELEFVLTTLPRAVPYCCDHVREQVETELRDLWRYRLEITEQ